MKEFFNCEWMVEHVQTIPWNRARIVIHGNSSRTPIGAQLRDEIVRATTTVVGDGPSEFSSLIEGSEAILLSGGIAEVIRSEDLIDSRIPMRIVKHPETHTINWGVKLLPGTAEGLLLCDLGNIFLRTAFAGTILKFPRNFSNLPHLSVDCSAREQRQAYANLQRFLRAKICAALPKDIGCISGIIFGVSGGGGTAEQAPSLSYLGHGSYYTAISEVLSALRLSDKLKQIVNSEVMAVWSSSLANDIGGLRKCTILQLGSHIAGVRVAWHGTSSR